MQVSIVIRAKNEEAGIRACLEGIKKQDYSDYEIILVDSGSTDRTMIIAGEYSARIIEIPPESFTFGYALNVGIEQAQGEIMVFLSAHCEPCDTQYLSNLVTPFRLHQNLAGVYGRQVPFQGANPIEKRGLEEAYPAKESFEIVSDSMFSNAHAAIRKSIWEECPFNENLSGAEDIAWAMVVQKKGYAIGYEPHSTLYHSHQETVSQAYIRSYREAVALQKIESHYFATHKWWGYMARCLRAIMYDYWYLVRNNEGIRYLVSWTIKIPFYRIGIYYGQYICARGSKQ